MRHKLLAVTQLDMKFSTCYDRSRQILILYYTTRTISTNIRIPLIKAAQIISKRSNGSYFPGDKMAGTWSYPATSI